MGETKNPEVPAAGDHYLVPGLMRGLDVLRAFTPQRRRMSLGEIADEIGITRSAAFRTVYTLAALGFLVHDPRRRSYALGPAVLSLGIGERTSRRLVEAGLQHLERLRDRVEWSTHLGVLDGRDVVYLIRVPTRRGLRSIVHVGSRLPAHATSMGRMLLGGLDEGEVRGLYRGVALVGAGPNTPTSLAALLRRHAEDRGRGFVVQDGGFEAGVASIAAPVLDAAGTTVAAINATTARQGPADPEGLDRLVAEVRHAADAVSRTLASLR